MRTPSKAFSAADAARLANFKPREASSGSFVSPRAGGAATRPATSPWSVAARAAAASPAGAAREAAARRGSRRDSPEAAAAAEALASPAAARRASSPGYPEAFPASFGAVACSSPGFGVDLVPREPCLYTLERFDKRRKTWRDGALRPYFPTRYGWRFTDGGLQADLWLESALDPGWRLRHRPVCPRGGS